MRPTLPLLLAACAEEPAPDRLYDAPATAAREAFFDALWAGDYDAVDPIADDLTAEALDGDAASQALVGFAHAWTLAERRRAPEPDPGVTAHADLAVLAFERAVEQSPDDARLVGFRGSMLQAQGSIWGDAALQRKGWFDTAESARRWPEWGKFTQAYGLVTMDKDERLFARGVELYWENLDACADEAVPRVDLDWAPYAAYVDASDDKNRRACGNTDVVPHNIEGFFVIMGDHVAKSGDLESARNLYENALALDDGTWPYRSVAEQRLVDLAELPAWFAVEPAEDEAYDPRQNYVFGGPYGCTICHQGAPGGLVGAP
jgi:tetratricopeptide (TPR) repeat protein